MIYDLLSSMYHDKTLKTNFLNSKEFVIFLSFQVKMWQILLYRENISLFYTLLRAKGRYFIDIYKQNKAFFYAFQRKCINTNFFIAFLWILIENKMGTLCLYITIILIIMEQLPLN